MELINKVKVAEIKIDGEKYLIRLDTFELFDLYPKLKIAADREGLHLQYVCVGLNSQYSLAGKFEEGYECLCSNHQTHKPNITGYVSASSDYASWEKFYGENEGKES